MILLSGKIFSAMVTAGKWQRLTAAPSFLNIPLH
jgi:hypothetical protein